MPWRRGGGGGNVHNSKGSALTFLRDTRRGPHNFGVQHTALMALMD